MMVVIFKRSGRLPRLLKLMHFVCAFDNIFVKACPLADVADADAGAKVASVTDFRSATPLKQSTLAPAT